MEPARIAAIPLFADLDEETLAALATVAAGVEVDAGKSVVAEGDFGNALFAIESGTAEVSTEGKPVATLGAGDVFGEIAVVASGRRTASVVASTPMRLIAIFKTDIWALERRNPAAAERFRALIKERVTELNQIRAGKVESE